ncbi:cobyric acid synthase [Vibrio sp. TRT 21S02]|uniref:cobyric acid synthase n=1 Tax=Vibrio sp. TRT 21S02 TaxID=3418507 RepID=UPI003CE861F8
MQSPTRALMVQGTTSDAGKSVLVAGLCRVLARKGVRVAPFKPQNMALNSAVTPSGGEIGRAQAVQAQAANIPSTVHMNPVLLKPSTDTGCQVIVQGQAIADMAAIGYQHYKELVLPKVVESFELLQSQYDCVMIEGAGSPAEINLRQNDIANMGFAEKTDVPVIIVADIDRGGVFAHLVGTLELLSPSEQDRVIGFVINRFRGDLSLLKPGLDWLEDKTKKPVLGVLPYLHGFDLEAEDAINAEQTTSKDIKLNVVIPVFPRISNHTDFDALRRNPDIDVRYAGKGEKLDKADLIILPGTKSVRADLQYLKEQGWQRDILKHLRFGGKVLGICGGYQMLGNIIDDPKGVEGEQGQSAGLGLLDVSTILTQKKALTNVSGKMNLCEQVVPVRGYEIHVGETQVSETSPITLTCGTDEGAISDCNQVMGTYLHGILDSPEALDLIAQWTVGKTITHVDPLERQENAINQIADAIESHMKLNRLWPELGFEQ